MPLNPTLWRTCRVLKGKTRLHLLRRVVTRPGWSVSDLAADVGISRPRASQELRRLQSRGLTQCVRAGPMVIYQPIPDPQVPTAAPLLTALKTVLSRFSRSSEAAVTRIASGFSHPRRIAIVRELLRGSKDKKSIRYNLGMPRIAFNRHFRQLCRCGLAQLSQLRVGMDFFQSGAIQISS